MTSASQLLKVAAGLQGTMHNQEVGRVVLGGMNIGAHCKAFMASATQDRSLPASQLYH